MKTFAELMEQIPHMTQDKADLARISGEERRKRLFDRHVHRELSHTAELEKKALKDVYNT
jgi:hypothetical protein